MLKRTLIPLCAALAVAVLPSAASYERQLKDSDLKKFAEKLAGFMEAKQEGKEIAKAEEEVSKEIAKLQKKLKGADPLALAEDLGQGLWMSANYPKARVKKGKVEEVEYESGFFGDDGLTYAIWVPKSYNPRDTAYPLVLTIPDAGVTPHAHITEKWTDAELRENAIIAAPSMPEDGSLWSVAGEPGAPGGVAYVLTTLKAVSESYGIDFNRVYLAGRGAGVPAAVEIGGFFPDRFAGVIGRSGDAGEVNPANMRNLPTFFAGAGAQATAYQESVKEAGYDNCTIQTDGKESDIWNWMIEHPRNSLPDEVTLVPGAPFPITSYWIGVPPSAGAEARLDARIDRENNTIHIDATGITNVFLYLNDELVNLDEPVKVICNGAEHIEAIPRSLKTTLQFMFEAKSDPGRVFVATNAYDVPANSTGG